ncbi:MAG: hypothetical protein SGILL_001955 [Bacillariaceae sp.]
MWTKAQLVEMLSGILLEGLCGDHEEAIVLSEILLEGDVDRDGDSPYSPSWLHDDESLMAEIMDNLGVEAESARDLIDLLKERMGEADNGDGCESDDNDDCIGNKAASDSELEENKGYEDQDSETEYLEDGECELCDRYIKLTKHHLIPKETWARIQTKLLHAAEAKRKGEVEKAAFLLGPGLENTLGALSSDKTAIRRILQHTCEICRQCHTAVHRTHSNMELALHYNSVDKLLEDETISKFCMWASKQRAGKYKR